MNSRVALKDIARQMGLSIATVSLALRESPKIPVKTREKVLQEATRLGYRPDPLLSELGSLHWKGGGAPQGTAVAYILCTPGNERVGFEFSSDVLRAAAGLGYRFQIFRRCDFASSAALQRALHNQGLTNVILGPVYEKSLTVELDWSKFISVQLTPGFLRLPLHSVVKDHFNTVIMAWEKVVQRGYRRIGITLLDHRVKLMDDFLRLSAADCCQRRLYPELPVIPHFIYDYDEYRLPAFYRWIKRHRVEVIIGFNNLHADEYRRETGKFIPFVSLSKTNAMAGYSGMLDEPATYAKEAISLLHLCRRVHQWGIPQRPIDHTIEPVWSEGDSLPIR